MRWWGATRATRDLAEIIRARFTAPTKTLPELYGRLVFNVLCGNTDGQQLGGGVQGYDACGP